jgi:hypothetical protein
MILSSSITAAADGEHLMCGGFSLDEPVCLGNFDFIIDYFGSLSLSPRRGNEGAVFVGLTRSGVSTPHQATIEDSTEEFLTMSSREGSFSHPSPRWRSTGGSFAPTTTTWKESALTMVGFPPRTAVPRLETIYPFEQCHTHHEGQLVQTHARHPPTKLGPVPWRSSLVDRQIATAVQPDVSPRHEPTLKMERILMVAFTSTQVQAKDWPLHSTEERP